MDVKRYKYDNSVNCDKISFKNRNKFILGEKTMARKDSALRAMEKAGGFASAKKNVIIQYQGMERNTDHILNLVRKDAAAKGINDEEIEIVDIYIKPEEQAVFYVINKDIEGQISL